MTPPRAAIDVLNPYSGARVGSVSPAGETEIDATVRRARSAVDRDDSLPVDRRDFLAKGGELLRGRTEELAQLVTRETGKPIGESRVEVERACTTLTWSAEESLRLEGTIHECGVTPQRLRQRAYVLRVPLGIVAAVTPFNFPLNIPAHKIGPALAAGNAVIVKPSPKAPLATQELVGLLHEAGVPEGMLQLVHGGPGVVERLARAEIDALTFTGSTQVGRRIATWAAGKKVVMELGGNDPIVVMEDANLERAAAAVLTHRFGSSGQRCTSCKRAFFHVSVYGEMRQRLLDGVAHLVVGDPMDESTDVGPLIDEEAAERVLSRLESAVLRGARVLCGGTREGAIIAPTVVEGVRPDDVLFREETFGPVLPIVSFSTFDEAVDLVNATPYGLQAGIFSDSMTTILDAFRRFEVGAVIVNDGPGFRVESIPFGGVKASGIGREGIRYSIEEFTTLKSLVM